MIKHLYSIGLTVAIALLLFAGCKSKPESDLDAHDDHHHAEGGHSATVWQDSLELFVEWSEFVSGTEIELIVHLTDLLTFKPVTEGTLTATLVQNGRELLRRTANQPVRPGIYDIPLTAPVAGDYEVTFALTRSDRTQRVRLSNVHVVATTGAEHAHDEHAGEPSTDPVTFLKEQQWQVEFATQAISRRTLSDNIRALGEIKAAGVGEAEVFAPFDGVLMPDPLHGIVRPGQQVSKGEVLARIAPSGGPGSGWTQLLNDFRLAKSEYDRVSRLADEGAVSERRRDEARLELENKRSRVRGALGGTDSDLDSLLAESDYFHLRAPANGVITDIHLRYGQHVETGEHLFNIIDPSRIWLEVQVPASESSKLDQVSDATFTLSGSDVLYRVSDLGGRLVTVSTLLDPVTRRVPVIFELRNTEANFRPGSFAQVYLKTRSSREALAVPESSILDEDGTPVVYVQIGGEEFARRVVQTAAKDEGYVEITNGLEAGERVVVNGAYKVRLASLKISAADAGHAGHAH